MALHFLVFLFLLNATKSEDLNSYKTIKTFFMKCADKNELVKCLKIQALKLANRAINSKNIQIFDGVSLVRDNEKFHYYLNLNDTKLQALDPEQLNNLLSETSSK